MLAMVAQQAAEIRGVEEELQKVQSDKEALLENNAGKRKLLPLGIRT